jgi:hypothetical protein
MNVTKNAVSISECDETLIELMARTDGVDSLNLLFTPLESNEPVEQATRRT